MNKKEAAAYLNLSTRAVERAVTQGKLSVRYKKDKHGNIALFNPVEVRRYKAAIEVPAPRRAIVNPVRPMTPATPTAPDSQTNYVLGSLTPLEVEDVPAATSSLPTVPIADKLTLSLAEAASLSGLSQKYLRQSIRDNKLKAFKHDQDWRIKRVDLDGFVRGL